MLSLNESDQMAEFCSVNTAERTLFQLKFELLKNVTKIQNLKNGHKSTLEVDIKKLTAAFSNKFSQKQILMSLIQRVVDWLLFNVNTSFSGALRVK